ncbi:MAG TPA: hypothetical protein VK612_04615 [Pyrinomonadaceae bacterium]|nr:hypothetical protein [Pyrinomonadaceae bacterium]
MLRFVEFNNKQLLRSDEAMTLLAGDAAKWNTDWFGQVFSKPDKIISIKKDYSVARTQMVDKNSRVVDMYFYLTFEDGWKIRSMRAMAQTGFLDVINTSLKSKPLLTTEEKETLANTELVLSSDKMLTQWFQKSRLELDKLTALAVLETKPKPVKTLKAPPKTKNGVSYAVGVSQMEKNDTEDDEPQTISYISAYRPAFPKTANSLKKLNLSVLEIKSNGNIEITIGGITDNSVGFVYSPSGSPPLIDGWRYIWVERIAPKWYLFRTT